MDMDTVYSIVLTQFKKHRLNSAIKYWIFCTNNLSFGKCIIFFRHPQAVTACLVSVRSQSSSCQTDTWETALSSVGLHDNHHPCLSIFRGRWCTPRATPPQLAASTPSPPRRPQRPPALHPAHASPTAGVVLHRSPGPIPSMSSPDIPTIPQPATVPTPVCLPRPAPSWSAGTSSPTRKSLQKTWRWWRTRGCMQILTAWCTRAASALPPPSP